MLVRPAAFSFLCCSMSASIVSGGDGGSWTSDLARSISSPFSSPLAPRVMRPPGCCGVSFVMCHFRSAAEFRMYSWPPRTRTTGLAGDTVSESARYGSRCSFSCASCQSLFETITSPGRLCFTRAATAARMSARLRAPERSTPGTAAGIVEVPVGEARNHRLPVQIDRRRLRTGEPADRGDWCRPR